MDENQQGVEQVSGSDVPPSEVEQTEIVQETEQVPSQTDTSESQDKDSRAFYAMRKKIEELERKLESQTEDHSLLDLARGTVPSSTDFSAEFASYGSPKDPNVEFDETDPATKAFLTEAQAAKQEAHAARQAALRAQAQLEDYEAWQKYPFLKPKSPRTDEQRDFFQDVKAQYLAERLDAQKKGLPQPRLVEVADRVQDRYERIRGQVRESVATEVAATQQQKDTANLESRGTRLSTSTQADSDRIEELRRKVHSGNIDALMELNKLTDPYFQEE